MIPSFGNYAGILNICRKIDPRKCTNWAIRTISKCTISKWWWYPHSNDRGNKRFNPARWRNAPIYVFFWSKRAI